MTWEAKLSGFEVKLNDKKSVKHEEEAKTEICDPGS